MTESHGITSAGDAGGESSSLADEELFETYLAARLQQALEALDAAREALAAEPGDLNRALAVMRRLRELREAQAELERQRARVAAVREAAGMPAASHEPPARATPGPEFRALQAEKARRVMAALARRPRTCPQCQAPVDPDEERCGCGRALASGWPPLDGALMLSVARAPES
ncbi:MAG TPA: hypothetical protein VIL43_09580 [Burkholderiales bacterium]